MLDVKEDTQLLAVLEVQEAQEALEEVLIINQDLYKDLLDLLAVVAVDAVLRVDKLAKLVVLVVIGQPQVRTLTTAEMVAVEQEQSLDPIIL